MSDPHFHKCAVYECETFIECPGPCAEGEVPVRSVCSEHQPMYDALNKILDDAGYVERGGSWYVNGVKGGDIPRLF